MEMFKNKFVVVFDKLIDFLNHAQKQKFLVSGANTDIIGTMIFGCITHLMRTEMLRKTILGVPGLLDPDHIEKTIKQVADNLLNGITPR